MFTTKTCGCRLVYFWERGHSVANIRWVCISLTYVVHQLSPRRMSDIISSRFYNQFSKKQTFSKKKFNFHRNRRQMKKPQFWHLSFNNKQATWHDADVVQKYIRRKCLKFSNYKLRKNRELVRKHFNFEIDFRLNTNVVWICKNVAGKLFEKNSMFAMISFQ